MNKTSFNTDVSGGIAAVVGAQNVSIANLTIYSAATSPHGRATAAIPPCPYPGLAYFGPQDAARFYGRQQAVQALVKAVEKRGFTAVVGASGAGKSSAVLAGLAPRLDALGSWRSTYFRIGTEPDKNPFSALARALEPLTRDRDLIKKLKEVRKLAEGLSDRSITLTNIVATCRSANPGKRILLIADQFEEVFTLVSDEGLRNSFIDTLIAAFPDPAQGVMPDVVLALTLRADFYNAALGYRPLADRLQDHVENLGPMTRDELREAILEPAKAVGVHFERGLAETILDYVGKRPGSLPLLQFALREMWGRMKTPLMTRDDYEAIDGVEGALAKHAQAIFNRSTDYGNDETTAALFRRLFTRLVTLGEGVEDTSRIVSREELGPEAWALAQRLANEDNRLVVTAAVPPARENAEVVHEALIRYWPILVEWISRDRAFQLWVRQLGPRVKEWRANPIDEGTLLSGGPLALAVDWYRRRGDELSDDERAYIDASARLRELQEREKSEKELELRHQNASFLGALANVELLRGNIGSALRLAVKATRADLELPINSLSNSTAAAGLVASVWRARWRVSFGGHENHLTSAAYSPDGSRVVTASWDNTARIWDPVTATEIVAFRGHYTTVNSAVFCPKGSRVVTASNDNTARIWDATSAKEIAILRGHNKYVNTAAFSPDASRVVTASHDRTARIWDVATAEQIAVLHGHEDHVTCAAFSPDGSRIVTAAKDSTVRIWDAATYREITILRQSEKYLTSAAFSPDGTMIVAASWDRTARIWDVEKAVEVAVLRGHENYLTSATFSPDGSMIVTAAMDATARIWAVKDAAEILVLRGHEDQLASATFSPDGSRIVTASRDKTSRIWDIPNVDESTVLHGHKSSVTCAAFSPDGSRVVTAARDHTARIWDVASVKEIAILQGHQDCLTSAAFNPDGSRVVTSSWDQTARIWEVATVREIAVLRGHEGWVISATFSPDGFRIVTASADETARIWDVVTGSEVAVLRGHTASVTSAAYSRDGSRIVTASWDRTARIWDAATGREIAVLRGHNQFVNTAAFSFDGSRIVTASNDKTARIWDPAIAEEIAVLPGHDRELTSAMFSPDGSRIVTASEDASVRIWDTATALEIAVLRGHKDRVFSVAFSPDGLRLVTASNDDTARIWDAHLAIASTEDILIEACGRRLGGLSKLTRHEMRLAGYSDSDPLIDVCAGVGEAGQ
jgi:WD40 repeat protein